MYFYLSIYLSTYLSIYRSCPLAESFFEGNHPDGMKVLRYMLGLRTANHYYSRQY